MVPFVPTINVYQQAARVEEPIKYIRAKLQSH